MKYYLREMHGSFVQSVLLRVPDDYDPPKPQVSHYTGFAVAHSYSVPDCYLTKKIMPEHTDFSLHWDRGDARGSSAGSTMGGHHVGVCKEITEEEAKEIWGKVEMSTNKRNADLIKTGLYLLESACHGNDLHYELEDDLGGTPTPEEIRALMDIIKTIEL